MDDQIRHDVTVPSTSRFVVFAGRASTSGEIILKAVNTSGEPVTAAIELQGATAGKFDGTVTRLQGQSLTAENSFESPLNVADKTEALKGVTDKFNHSFPPYSFTAIRLKPMRK